MGFFVPEGFEEASIDDLLRAPADFDRKALVLKGVQKMGTKTKRAAGGPTRILLNSQAGKRLTTPDGRFPQCPLDFILDDKLARDLEQLVRGGTLPTQGAPEIRCVPTVRVVNEGPDGTPCATIVALDMLGSVQYLMIADGVIQGSMKGVSLPLGDGQRPIPPLDEAAWIEHLGGEQYVANIKREVKKAIQTMMTNANRANAQMKINDAMRNSFLQDAQNRIQLQNQLSRMLTRGAF